jgi:ketosteroid isomerase-like protein
MSPAETAVTFMDSINAGDVEGLVEMMTEDHTFIDSLGQAIRGRTWMRPAWKAYFDFCAEYWVSHEQIIESGGSVAIFGKAGGIVAGTRWETPAAWRAVIVNGQVQEWRVYADNKPVYDILAARTAETSREDDLCDH